MVWEVGRGDGDIWNGPWDCGVFVVVVAAGNTVVVVGLRLGVRYQWGFLAVVFLLCDAWNYCCCSYR